MSVYAHNLLMFWMVIFFASAHWQSSWNANTPRSSTQWEFHILCKPCITLVQTVLCCHHWAPAEKDVCIIKDTNCSLSSIILHHRHCFQLPRDHHELQRYFLSYIFLLCSSTSRCGQPSWKGCSDGVGTLWARWGAPESKRMSSWCSSTGLETASKWGGWLTSLWEANIYTIEVEEPQQPTVRPTIHPHLLNEHPPTLV